ncbi:hypothetical protein HYDPIDRAFT_33779 [Hydnomerulius pinastri MD-312]|uniref:Transmembrane protein n=1 Tax=Hydnomerulius pinastri MD-312 TaxID=994086 RepID=A0A0C9W7H9_9AGAM|nr:hypothetical protein HYDPIDRAFT_33779 [Hydnomerulius pinastri MD-312]
MSLRPPSPLALHPSFRRTPSLDSSTLTLYDTGSSLDERDLDWRPSSALSLLSHRGTADCQRTRRTPPPRDPLRRWCYILHGVLVILHVILLGMLVDHPEHRVTIASNSNELATLLSALLQAFYTIYTAILVFVTQRLALSGAVARRQMLTAVHDTFAAWNGLGASINVLWQQTEVAASVWSTLAIVVYLTCISVLHIASSSIIQFQAFNNTITSNLPSTSMWPGTSVNLSALHWSALAPVVPLMRQLPGLTIEGCTNATLYDVPTEASNFLNGSVTATTLRARCGLLSNISLQAVPHSMDLLNVSMSGIGPVTLYIPGPPWRDSVMQLRSIGTLSGSNPPQRCNHCFDLLFVSSTAMELGNMSASDVSVAMNWTYFPPGGKVQTSTTSVYFAACSLDARSNIAELVAPNNALELVLPAQPDTSSPWSVWSPGGNKDLTEGITTALQYVGPAPHRGFLQPVYYKDSHVPFFWSGLTPTGMDIYISSLLGINLTDNLALSYSQSSEGPRFTLSQNQLENAVSQMAAELIWLAGSANTGGGGFERTTGESSVTQQVLEWRLNINTTPICFASLASLIILVLGINILQIIWLGSQTLALHGQLHSVQIPALDGLRAAGMFDVCLAEPHRAHPRSRGSLHGGDSDSISLWDLQSGALGVQNLLERGMFNFDFDPYISGNSFPDSRARSSLRHWCYMLHGLLVLLHVVLLALLSCHPERRIVVSLNNDEATTLLSAMLQSFYTLYTAVIVFVTQRAVVVGIISQKQKLTTLHDISGAWSGIGAAINTMWQQTNVAVSTWAVASVTLYLASISVLHITSSTIMQFQEFNSTTSRAVQSTLTWPDPTVNLSSLDWKGSIVASVVPLMYQISGLSIDGLHQSTLFDIPSADTSSIYATVNTTTVQAHCGLLSNLSVFPEVESRTGQIFLGVNFSMPGVGSGRLPQVTLWKDVVKFLGTGSPVPQRSQASSAV